MGLWNNIKNSFNNADYYATNTSLYSGGAIGWGVVAVGGIGAIVASGGALSPAMMPIVLPSVVASLGCASAAMKAHEAGDVNKKAISAGVGKTNQDNSKKSFRDKWKMLDKADKFKIVAYAAGMTFFAAATIAMGAMAAPVASVCAYAVSMAGMGQAATCAMDIAENNAKIKAAEKAGQSGLTKQTENSRTRTRENTNHITMEPQLHTSDDVRKKMPHGEKTPAVAPVKISTRAFDFDFMKSQNQGGRKF